MSTVDYYVVGEEYEGRRKVGALVIEINDAQLAMLTVSEVGQGWGVKMGGASLPNADKKGTLSTLKTVVNGAAEFN